MKAPVSGGTGPGWHASDSRAYFEAVLAAAVDGIVVIDERGRIEIFNAAAEAMFGWAASEVIGGDVAVLMPEPFRSEHQGYVERYLRTGNPKIIGIGREVVARRRDGLEFAIHLAVGEIESNGGPRRFVGLIRDLSSSKATEKRLHEKEEEFRLAFENAPAGVATLTRDGRFLEVNPAFCDVVRRPREALVRKPIRELVLPEDAVAHTEMLDRLSRGEIAGVTHGFRLVRGDGEVRECVLRGEGARGEEGSPRSIIVHLEDRTDRIRAEAEIRSARAKLAHAGRIGLLGELTAGLAHEVTQPLTAIASFARACARIVRERPESAGECLHALESIESQALRAGEVVHRVRELARRGRIEASRVEVNGLARETAKLAREGEWPAIEIHLDLEENLPPIAADRIQVQQVILNLLRNGVEATGEGNGGAGVAIVTRRAGEGAVEVAVVDHGRGVDAEAESGLFEPFFTTKDSGMGMGLAICQSIVKEHGGELWFTRNAGDGTTFHFTVPVVPEETS